MYSTWLTISIEFDRCACWEAYLDVGHLCEVDVDVLAVKKSDLLIKNLGQDVNANWQTVNG